MIDQTNRNPYVLIEQIENIHQKEFYLPEEFNSLVDALSEMGEPAVEALLEKMTKLVNLRLRYVGAHVFARVGYPVNSKALEFMVSDVSNPNSSSHEISFEAVLKVGAPALPLIDKALEFYRHDGEDSVLEIDSLEDLKNRISSNTIR